jgi:hypothetical protein
LLWRGGLDVVRASIASPRAAERHAFTMIATMVSQAMSIRTKIMTLDVRDDPALLATVTVYSSYRTVPWKP